MLWTLVNFFFLRRLRRDSPCTFDPKRAVESVNEAIAETEAEMGL